MILPMHRIRPLLPADLAAVVRIQAECYTEIVPEQPASLAAKMQGAPGTCFAAEAHQVVAYLIAVPVVFPHLPMLDAPAFALPPGADTLYLHDLAVAPAGRGTGAGEALVRSALRAGAASGLRQACLVAIQGSVRYWQRFGFETMAVPSPAIAAKLASYGPAAQLMTAPLRAPPA